MNNTKISYLSRNQYQYLGHLVAAYYSFIDPDKNERLMIELAGWHADLQRTVYIFVKRHRQSYDIIYLRHMIFSIFENVMMFSNRD